MTLLHVTDFHFNQRWFRWLSDRAPAHDLLVMSGDMLDLRAATPHARQIAWVSDWIREYPRAICICSGNHDLEWDAFAERWRPAYWLRDLAGDRVAVDGQRVKVGGLSLLNIGCATRPKGGVADVWVVHAPPRRTLVALCSSGADRGDPELVFAMRRFAPRVVLCGHVHSPMSWREDAGSTLFLNPGRADEADFPNHIVVETNDLSCRFVRGAIEAAPESASELLAVPAGVRAEPASV